MMRALMAVAVVGSAVAVAHPLAQAQGTTGRGAAPKRAVAAPRTNSARVSVKDQAGASLSGVRLLLSGSGTGEFTTGAAGTAIVPDLKDGTYRVRCEREGFITLEREFTLYAMKATKGNQVRAAKLLGITRATLRKRIERFGITKELTIS